MNCKKRKETETNKQRRVFIYLHGTNWIASSGTGQLVSYVEGASLDVQISHVLQDPLLIYVPIKNKIKAYTCSIYHSFTEG